IATELFFRRLALNFRFFQLPILDPEGFRRRQRDVIGVHAELAGLRRGTRLGKKIGLYCCSQRGSAFHHVYGIGVELVGDARLGLVLVETEHADAWNQNGGGICVARFLRIWPCERLVVTAIFLAITSRWVMYLLI